MKIRIVSQNPVFARAGRLFRREDDLGNVIDHEVSAEEGAAILGMPDSIFREVGEDGNVIQSETDKATTEKVVAEENARTFKVPGTDKTDDTPVAPTTETPVEVADDAADLPPDAAEVEATATETVTDETAAPTKKTTIKIGGAKQEAPTADTDGAVEV